MMENGQRHKLMRRGKTPTDMRNHCPKGDGQLELDLLGNGTQGGFSGGLLTSRVRAHQSSVLM